MRQKNLGGGSKRDYSTFDSELSGAVLNLHLFARIMHWLNPYRLVLFVSVILILIASYFTVIMEIMISRVLVDYIIVGDTESPMPDLYMIEATQWVEQQLGIEPIFAAGLIFFVVMVLFTIAGHAHQAHDLLFWQLAWRRELRGDHERSLGHVQQLGTPRGV